MINKKRTNFYYCCTALRYADQRWDHRPELLELRDKLYHGVSEADLEKRFEDVLKDSLSRVCKLFGVPAEYARAYYKAAHVNYDERRGWCIMCPEPEWVEMAELWERVS